MKLPYTRALVTGATGFVGSTLCEALVAAGVQVHALGLQSEHALPQGIVFHQGDITDATFVEDVLRNSQPEVVFHLAAYGTFSHEKDEMRMIDVNIKGTINLVAASVKHGVTSFIHAGSVKEYATGRVALSEHVPVRPWDKYAATKAAAHFFCRLAAQTSTMRVTVLRLSPVYGPGDALSRFVFTAIRSSLEGTPFTLSVASLVRNFVYIDDVVTAFLQSSIRSQGEAYEECNIGSLKPYSFLDILTAIEKVTGKPIQKTIQASDNAPDDSWVVDIQKAEQLLQWRPEVSLEEGMEKAVAWFRAQS